MILNISQTKSLKLLSVHKYTHQMQTYCDRKNNYGTVTLMERLLKNFQCDRSDIYPGVERGGNAETVPSEVQVW